MEFYSVARSNLLATAILSFIGCLFYTTARALVGPSWLSRPCGAMSAHVGTHAVGTIPETTTARLRFNCALTQKCQGRRPADSTNCHAPQFPLGAWAPMKASHWKTRLSESWLNSKVLSSEKRKQPPGNSRNPVSFYSTVAARIRWRIARNLTAA